MDMLEAVKLRHSVRHYTDSPIEAEKVKLLRDSVNAINKKTGLHFQLITDEPEGFTGALAHYGNISRRDLNQSRLTNENFLNCFASNLEIRQYICDFRLCTSLKFSIWQVLRSSCRKIFSYAKREFAGRLAPVKNYRTADGKMLRAEP